MAWTGINHQGLNKSINFRQTLFNRYAAALLQGITDGSDEDANSLNTRSRDYRILNQIRRNVLAFALAKVNTVENESNISDRFSTLNKHRRYAEAEYNLITAGTQMAQKWGDITDRANVLPWLQYDAINDDRTRDDHRMLDGVTLPVTDQFWNQWLPPNGWNCRCTVRQLAQAERVEAPALPNDTETPPYLRHNPGMSGIIFGERHGYFNRAASVVEVRNAAAELAIFDLVYTSASGARVVKHPFDDPKQKESLFNIEQSKVIADSGLSVKIEPYRDLNGAKNPDISIDGVMSDLKRVEGKVKSSVQRGVERANKQKVSHVTIVMDKNKYDKKDTIKALMAASQPGRNSNITVIAFVIDNQYVSINRSDITYDYLWKKLP